MVKKLLFSLLLFLNAHYLNAQFHNQLTRYLQANAIWAFGSNAGLNWNAGSQVGIHTELANSEGATAVADPVTGKLLFYSDGDQCWSADDQVMPNGTGLLGNGAYGSTSQGVCIVPLIESANKYYLFSLNSEGGIPSLYYSIVDMSLNNGLGDIVNGRKNVLLHAGSLSESMVAIPGDNCDIWLMVHEYQNPVFKAYHITRNGLDTIPVVSNTGAALSGGGAYLAGCMAASSDRKTIAIGSYNCPAAALPEEIGALICKFDPATGKVSDGIKIFESTVYGICFSPDNSKLYIANADVNAVYQLNVSTYDSTAIVSSSTLIVNTKSFAPYLRLYRDTVYASANDTLCRINRPNLVGAACDFQFAAVPLYPGTSCVFGLGSDVVYPLPPDTSHHALFDTLVCTSNAEGRFTYPLTLAALPTYYAYEWDDGSNDTVRAVTKPGIYWVLCKDSCHSRVDTFRVRQVNIHFSLGADTVLCDQATYTLKTDFPGAKFLWQDGSTGSSYTVTGSGNFWVTLFKDGCSATDSIKVSAKFFVQNLGTDTTVCKGEPANIRLTANVPEGAEVTWSTGSHEPTLLVQDSGTYWVRVNEFSCLGTDTFLVRQEMCACFFTMPNVFTPNGDGINDQFWPVIESGCPVNNYAFNIYNRFGQLVFSDINLSKGWDGSFNGNLADGGTYFYEIKFEGGTHRKKYYQKGDIILIR